MCGAGARYRKSGCCRVQLCSVVAGGVSSAGGGRAGALSTAELLTQLPEQSCQPGDTVIVTLSLYDETRAAAHRAQAVLLCPSA